MARIPLSKISYSDALKNIKRFIDIVNKNFAYLDWLIKGNISTDNLNTGDIQVTVNTEAADMPEVADEFGVNNQFVDFYPNMYSNSGMECFDSITLKPDYHDTDGVVSADSKFKGDYSLKLEPGQYMEQAQVGGSGFADPDWWSWCVNANGFIQTRITFRAKGSGGAIRIRVYQGGNLCPLWIWSKDADGNDVQIVSDSNLDVAAGVDWPVGEISFVVNTLASGGKIKLRIDNIGAVNVYLDAFSITPDWTGKWPQIYKPGPHSGGAVYSDTYYEHGTADWDPSGVEFTLENLYTDMPNASGVVTVEYDGDASVISTSQFIMVCKMVQEEVDSVNYYSKILVVPKGSSIPSEISGGKIQLKAICTGMVARPEE